jgi:multiple RNA-binding domain-containing protein 1
MSNNGPNTNKLALLGINLKPTPQQGTSSRLIVKNLPKHLTNDRFKQHFAKLGVITDCKLVTTKQGQFRQFGYIGYKTEKEAVNALDYFNNTFIDTSKITVELARPVGEHSDRPWSKYTQGSSAHSRHLAQKQSEIEKEKLRTKQLEEKKKLNKEAVEKDIQRKRQLLVDIFHQGVDVDDPKLKEYLSVMQPRSNKQTWTNDDGHSSNLVTNLKKQSDKLDAVEKKIKSQVVAVANKKPGGSGLLVSKVHVKFDSDESDESDEDYQDLHAAPSAKSDSEESEKGSEKESEREKEEENEDKEEENEDKEEEENEDKEEKKKKKKEDNKQKKEKLEKSLLSDSDSEKIQMHQQRKERKKTMPDMDLIADTGRLFLRNLAFTCTQEDLQKFFSRYGPISEIHIPMDKKTKAHKGIAFILFLLPEHAIKAFLDANGKIFQGRLLDILPGKEKPVVEVHVDEKSSYKKQLAKKRTETSFWNSLFMNRDAVAESMAKRLGVSKADILNPEASDVAVRMALAETQIINETKEFLKKHGVDLDSVTDRSTTVLLVKNIPSTTEESELRQVFVPHGELGRVLLVPSKTFAVVEYLYPNEAKAAYRHLNYSKFKHLPLFLEWAPANVFSTEYSALQHEAPPEEPTMEEETEGMTLFVKNLSFKTTKETLESVFKAISDDPQGIRNVTIATKPDPKHKGQTLSMGFGFVEFAHKQDIQRALKNLQGVLVDGHALTLKLSQRTSEKPEKSKKAKTTPSELPPGSSGTKLLVRNVPFESTRHELKSLFSQFGNLKSFRLPKKFDGTHRGFAFVDFLTTHDAKNAMTNLSATHFYGRHLVLEWADEGLENVDDLRARTRLLVDEPDPKRRRITLEREDGGGEGDESE